MRETEREGEREKMKEGENERKTAKRKKKEDRERSENHSVSLGTHTGRRKDVVHCWVNTNQGLRMKTAFVEHLEGEHYLS